MARILVLYYSSYGHLALMADAVAEGVRQAGHECDVLRVPETAPAEVAAAAGFRVDDSHALIPGVDALRDYDGIGHLRDVTIRGIVEHEDAGHGGGPFSCPARHSVRAAKRNGA